ncbi:Planctomycete cytochrome C [Planctomycetales bacterium 10988]|nr:Planctomycete cytochrome C [Planctomycetales bacterium 10988]
MIALFCSQTWAEDLDHDQVKFFETKIRPVLVERCYHCHSGEDAENWKGGLRVDTRDGMLEGGDSGPSIDGEHPGRSLLLEALRYESYEMPPDEKLPEDVIADFAIWVNQGAPDPRYEGSKWNESSQPEGGLWSLEPVQKPEVPEVEHRHWPANEADHFILAKQEAAGITPTVDADRATLIRRVTYDLTGLPPTPQEVADFLSDQSPNAFEKVVDRLLASPPFGERWGRHWMDVVRFAESSGHERNFTYPYAWRYRDYIIESFNEDKPYDQFVREQLAGDLLPSKNIKQEEEQKIATGFLAIGPRDLLQGNNTQHELDTIDDQINVTSLAFMGMTVACARCHDHKFDPIPTKDYYSMAGIFLSTENLYGTVKGSGGGQNRHPSDLLALGKSTPKDEKPWSDYLDKKRNLEKDLFRIEKKLEEALRADQESYSEKLKKQIATIESKVDDLTKNAPPKPNLAMGVREAKEITDCNLYLSGNIRNREPKVDRGFLSAITVSDTLNIPKNASGRLQLAEWITAADHPLTSRVMVNRIWHHLFGVGIVETVDNFGATGRRPTHPELLDFLAAKFQEDGWSTKGMIKYLVLSHTYQLSSVYSEEQYQQEPDNKLLWRMRARRLEGEAIRDTILTLSHQLNDGVPEYGSIVSKLGNGCLERQINTDPLFSAYNFRSVYLPHCRYYAQDALDLFDGASSSLVVGNRSVTTIPSQSLYLLNNERVMDLAEEFARRLLTEERSDIQARIQLAYRLTFTREADPSEAAMVEDYVLQMEQQFKTEGFTEKQSERYAWTSFCQAMFTSAEFRYIF